MKCRMNDVIINDVSTIVRANENNLVNFALPIVLCVLLFFSIIVVI